MHRVPRRVLVLAIAIAITVCCGGVAHAEVAWNGDATSKTAVVAGYAYNETGRRSALMEYLGFDWSTIGNKQRQTLLTDRSGDNPFTQALSSVKNVQYESGDGALDWPVINVFSTIFGLSEQWDISLSIEQYDRTRDYVLSIITGQPTGGGGGGGGGPEIQDGYVIVPTVAGYADSPVTLPIAIELAKYEQIRAFCRRVNADTCLAFYGLNNYNGTTPTSANIFVMADGYNFRPYNSAVGYKDGFALNGSCRAMWSQPENNASELGGYVHVGTRAIRSDLDNLGLGSTNISWYATRPLYAYAIFQIDVGTDPTPTPVPTPTPDPPVTPPTPPTGPTFTFDPTISPTAGNPDYTEITDWLRLIYNEQVDQEVELHSVMNNLGTDLASWFQALSAGIESSVEWAVEELEYYMDDFASDLIMWLKTIVSRMGGNGTSKPDPTTDEPGFWEWLLERLLDFFAGNIAGAVDDLKDALTELTQFFPFSLPWDLMALIGLFAAEPVTPVFDIGMPVPQAISQTHAVSLHVDLTQWNGIMAIVRGLEKIFFAAWLISMVPQWLDDMKIGDDR